MDKEPKYQMALLYLLISLLDAQEFSNPYTRMEKSEIDILITDIKSLYGIDIYFLIDSTNEQKPKEPT